MALPETLPLVPKEDNGLLEENWLAAKEEQSIKYKLMEAGSRSQLDLERGSLSVAKTKCGLVKLVMLIPLSNLLTVHGQSNRKATKILEL